MAFSYLHTQACTLAQSSDVCEGGRGLSAHVPPAIVVGTNAMVVSSKHFINRGPKLDDRQLSCDFDIGFTEGRQSGRGNSGGQVHRLPPYMCMYVRTYVCTYVTRTHLRTHTHARTHTL